MPLELQRGPSGRVVSRLERIARGSIRPGPSTVRLLERWLHEAAGASDAADFAIEALAWAYALPRLAGVLPDHLAAELLEQLGGAAREASGTSPETCPWVQQMLGAELPLALAGLLREVDGPRLAEAGARSLEAAAESLLGSDGILPARHFPWLEPLLASWTRSFTVLESLPEARLNPGMSDRFDQLVRQVLRLVPLSAWASRASQRQELFSAALGRANVETRRAAAVQAARVARCVPKPPPLPSPACHSESAEFALLRCDWSAASPLLAVSFADGNVRLELGLGDERLLAGGWELQMRCDGRDVRPEGAWESVCWVSDEEVDYLELERRHSEGLRVQRHFVLARRERFLLLADAVLAERPGRIDYRGAVPLNRLAHVEAAEETRELLLTAGRRRAHALPLGLGEWRRDPRRGHFERVRGGLELMHYQQGRALFAPLFFDLDPRRARKPLTWRQLTVAEDRHIQPSDVAVGYRVKIGRQQWLFYRSLARPANRTVLGANLTSEFFAARFTAAGKAETLVEIE